MSAGAPPASGAASRIPWAPEGDDVARIGGRSSAAAWLVGVLCTGVIGGLLVLAAPAVPAGVAIAGDILRSASGTDPQDAPVSATPPPVATAVPACRALYPEQMWLELTQRAGGDPVQTAEPPPAPAGLTAALAPAVRVTCVFEGVNTGRIATTVADVGPAASGVARAALEASGFRCDPFGGGVRCVLDSGGAASEHVIRSGVWLATEFSQWQPDRYTERVAAVLWPQ